MRIKNQGSTADRLLRATSKKTGPIEIQRTIVVGGTPSQRTVQSIDIPAGGSVELSTTGYMLRLTRVHEDFTKKNATIPVELDFMIAGRFPVEFEIQAAGPPLPQPAPKDAEGNPLATAGPISIEGLEEGKYGSQPSSGGQTTAKSGTSSSSTSGSGNSGASNSR
ncbi:copper chaperone PCu(A)C [Amorphus orientalis]|uniref:Copper(I)-binding protein n=1 Tax=Amorphus orientalis TaxID=649198 RepID=A0AAE3VM98_9HYPH|nr:copper chaperone PCu(A)C [Amorphus orientalis]MDQ0314286.1 copper(I)-binding protein [Amorphus orientalis]